MPGSWSPLHFPNLNQQNSEITSPISNRYNCIAWAAGDAEKNWWPDSKGIGYWPPNIPREETLDAFVRAYASQGYILCEDDSLEAGFEKIAIYAERVWGELVPTHAALQQPNGHWTSKLGPLEDIRHDHLNNLDGPLYGTAVAYLKRAM